MKKLSNLRQAANATISLDYIQYNCTTVFKEMDINKITKKCQPIFLTYTYAKIYNLLSFSIRKTIFCYLVDCRTVNITQIICIIIISQI